MIVVSPGWLAPDLVEAVQRFRGEIYLTDGAIESLENGRHIEGADERAYHIVLLRGDELGACLRYLHRGNGSARIGGWAVKPELRKTRAAIRVVLEAVRLAERLGDWHGIATATVKHKSACMLQRLSGRVVARYYDPHYRCEMERLEFRLTGIKRRLAA